MRQIYVTVATVLCFSMGSVSAFAHPNAPTDPAPGEADAPADPAPGEADAPADPAPGEADAPAAPAPSKASSPDNKPRQADAPQESARRKPARLPRGTLTGARLLRLRDQAVRATVGFPDIELAYHFPYSSEIELIPRIQIAYGRNLSLEPNVLEAGSDARKELMRRGRWAVAGFLSGFIHLNMNEDDKVHRKITSAYGIGLGCPGVVATFALKPDIDINFGVQIQDIVYLDSDPSIELSIPFSLGFEIALTKNVYVVQRTEIGPDIYPGEDTKLQLRTYIGSGYLF